MRILSACLFLAASAGCRGPAPSPPEPPPANLKQEVTKAAVEGDIQEVDRLLNQGSNIEAVNESGRTPLILAALKGHSKLVEHLLRRGAYVNARDREGMTALMWAAFAGSEETVRILLGFGADPTAKDHRGQTALDWARKDQPSIRRMLQAATRSSSSAR